MTLIPRKPSLLPALPEKVKFGFLREPGIVVSEFRGNVAFAVTTISHRLFSLPGQAIPGELAMFSIIEFDQALQAKSLKVDWDFSWIGPQVRKEHLKFWGMDES